VKTRVLFTFALVAWAGAANAEPTRFHATAGGAHAVGGDQQREFGFGGGGSASVELPVGRALGVQATAAVLALSKGDPPEDPSLAAKGTGAAFLGTVGVRFRPLGGMRTAGPWIDANGGVAQTGANGRVAVDAHLGWDFRVTDASRWDVGPFVGYTQILQSDNALRGDDARIAWAGIQVSLGAPERALPPPWPEMGVVELPLRDQDGPLAVTDYCPPPSPVDGTAPEGCPAAEVRVVEDRILIDDVIHFEFDSPRIRHASYPLVRSVASFIMAHPELTLVSIEGHADAQGTETYNLKLSEARAASTRALLVRFGVDERRLRVVGHGKSRLKVPTNAPEQANRRVEFIVTRDDEPAKSVIGPPPSSGASSDHRGRP